MQHYEYYGKPWLAVIGELLKVDWRKYDDGKWGNDEFETTVKSEREIKKIIEEYKKEIPFDNIKKKLEDLQRFK